MLDIFISLNSSIESQSLGLKLSIWLTYLFLLVFSALFFSFCVSRVYACTCKHYICVNDKEKCSKSSVNGYLKNRARNNNNNSSSRNSNDVTKERCENADKMGVTSHCSKFKNSPNAFFRCFSAIVVVLTWIWVAVRHLNFLST